MFHYPRQEILAPVGLVTEPNEYKQYPSGALKIARNLTTRAPGKLLAAPNVRATVSPGGAADSVIAKLMPADTGIVYALVDDGIGNWSIFADAVAQTFVGSAVNAFSDTGRISWAQCAERVIVNGKFGNLVRDPVSISTNFRAAGLPQINIAAAGVFGITGFLQPGQSVSYRVCLVRRYAGDYTLRSAPSVVFRVHWPTASATPTTPLVAVKWPAGGGVEPGDIIELYRTDLLATTSQYADPGATFKLVQEYTLTAADIAAPPPLGLELFDTQPPILGTLKTEGRELYTNPGVEGETYANLRPPVAKCIATFKGFCFYGHTTEPAKLTFSVPGGWGDTTNSTPAGVAVNIARQRGIGFRSGAGVVAIGNPVINAVPAADIVGVKPGQLADGNFPANTVVSAVGVNTITMSNPAAFAGVSWSTVDVIEIDGVVYNTVNVETLLRALGGLMEVTFSQPAGNSNIYQTSFEMTLRRNTHPLTSSITVRATNGANYSPPLPEFTATALTIDPTTKKNRLVWTKEQQPEHAPSVSELDIGFGEMYALNVTRDCVWMWCSDGLFRLSGNAGSLGLGAWQVDYAIATLLLCAPQASTVLTDKLYGYTNEGVVEIDSAGNISHKTRKVIGDLLPGPRYEEVPNIIMERNERGYEVLLAVGEGSDFAHRIYVYNAGQKSWTYLDDNDDTLSSVSALGMFRLPPGGVESHVLIGTSPGFGTVPGYSSWDADNSFLEGEGRYQAIYGEDPLELKRWMWADYLFAPGTTGSITALWNDVLGFGPVLIQALDAGVYARAGVPRQVGLSHSLSPGFRWAASVTQRVFEGLSLAVKQRTNQSKKR